MASIFIDVRDTKRGLVEMLVLSSSGNVFSIKPLSS